MEKEYPTSLNGFDTNAELQQVTDIVNKAIDKAGCDIDSLYLKKLPSTIQIDLYFITHSSQSLKIRLRDTYDLEVSYVSDSRIKSKMFDLLVDLRYHLINGDFDFAFSKEVA